jgi:hypothetical protein
MESSAAIGDLKNPERQASGERERDEEEGRDPDVNSARSGY